MKDKKIIHITNAHAVDDPRVFGRHALTLVDSGYNVSFIGPFDKGDRFNKGVRVIGLGQYRTRWRRYTTLNIQILIKILKLRPDIIEFHDPDLVFLVIIPKMLGIKVIGNLHEDIASQVLNKYWIQKDLRLFLNKFLERFYPKLIKIVCNGVVCATSSIGKSYSEANMAVCRNFPSSEFVKDEYALKKRILNPEKKALHLVYVGVLEKRRGLDDMIKISESKLVSKLTLVGKFSPAGLEGQIRRKLSDDSKIEIVGEVRHEEVYKFIANSDVGVCFLERNKAYSESIPTKIFEYAYLGLPVIANNFSSIAELNHESRFGILLDQINQKSVEKALLEILQNYQSYADSSFKSRKIFSWNNEKNKYLEIIENVLR